MDLGEIIKLIGALGGAGTGIGMAFQKQGYPPGYMESMAAANAASTYANASLDPNSPYYRNIAETEELRGRGDLITAIRQMVMSDASRRARGLATINPERRDETIWGALVKGFAEAGLRAREMARARLLEMAAAQRGIASSYAPMMQAGFLTDALNRGTRAAGTAGAFDTVMKLGDWIGQKDKKTKGVQSTPSAYRDDLGIYNVKV